MEQEAAAVLKRLRFFGSPRALVLFDKDRAIVKWMCHRVEMPPEDAAKAVLHVRPEALAPTKLSLSQTEKAIA
jgi:hypothetical protein